MKPAILVVDDERAICIAIQRLLAAAGWEVDTAGSGEEAIERLGRSLYHLVVTDLSMKQTSGMDVLRWVKQHSPETQVIMITAYGSEKTAVEAMKLGAADYLPKPFDNDELELKVSRLLERMAERREARMLREQVSGAYRFENLIGKSPAMQRVFDVIRKVADSDLTVLVRGPSGTGKELVANAIHYNSPRRAKPLVKVNCAAFARELVESELFGHEKGAFTGATATREGKFEVAHGGTLFLDEIGDMALETQAKILRVLQERELERVGGNRTIKVDVRVIAATNHDLEAKVRAGGFREDLFYRLNVVPIVLPSLREREGDLPLLIEHFLDASSERLRRDRKPVSAAAMRALLAHEWKGNVRELEHAIEQAVVLASGDAIELEDLAPAVRSGGAAVERSRDGGAGGGEPARGHAGDGAAADAPDGDPSVSFRDAKQQLIERFEREFITEALARHHGNISKAAEEMGMYRQHLQGKLAEYGIDAATFKARSRA
ncbi:MAG TPA: sigma-54 dependent transcriptional regulator [Candidatus Binatia bacterium]|nr:sigma-54 dependent transcriptional regulator [Candidatus Binatia bacterium]